MNAQGETWTAEKAIRSAMMFVKHPRERATLEVGLAIVRLHSELVEALLVLLPGLTLDLRYATDDDDKEAMRSRIETVRTVLARAHALGEER